MVSSFVNNIININTYCQLLCESLKSRRQLTSLKANVIKKYSTKIFFRANLYQVLKPSEKVNNRNSIVKKINM